VHLTNITEKGDCVTALDRKYSENGVGVGGGGGDKKPVRICAELQNIPPPLFSGT